MTAIATVRGAGRGTARPAYRHARIAGKVAPAIEWYHQAHVKRTYAARWPELGLAPLGIWYLHVWHWEPNPSGVFADWNPNVKCR